MHGHDLECRGVVIDLRLRGDELRRVGSERRLLGNARLLGDCLGLLRLVDCSDELGLDLGRLVRGVARVLVADRVHDLGGCDDLGGVLLATEADLALVERHDRVGVVLGGDGLGDDERLRLVCRDDVVVLLHDVLVLLGLVSGREDLDRRKLPLVGRLRHLIGGVVVEGLVDGSVDDVVRGLLGRDLLAGVLLLAAEADLTLEERNALLGDRRQLDGVDRSRSTEPS